MNDNKPPATFSEDMIRACADHLFENDRERSRYLAKVAEAGMIKAEKTVRIPILRKIR